MKLVARIALPSKSPIKMVPFAGRCPWPGMARRLPGLLGTLLALCTFLSFASACDLCAIYSADNAREQRASGFLFTLSESYIPHGTLQLDGDELEGDDYRNSSVTHFVPGYNFTRRIGLSLNVPLVYHSFERSELRYSLSRPPVLRTERGHELGLGDLSLIARLTAYELQEMEHSLGINLLAGVKFPTGDTDRIADEVEQTRIYDALIPPGTPHDPLGHSISGVHQHELSPGSGSFDGIFGLTLSSRWKRWFLNAQIQYYLRTAGESDYEKGDELMVSGGPGVYLWSGKVATINLQANAGYDSMARDEVAGRISNYTGLTAWYLGPQVGATIGGNFSTVAGIDLPLHITNNGLQNVPDYRFHASLVWRF
jgi:hypothetical protein